jgi:hypothetical protein
MIAKMFISPFAVIEHVRVFCRLIVVSLKSVVFCSVAKSSTSSRSAP